MTELVLSTTSSSPFTSIPEVTQIPPPLTLSDTELKAIMAKHRVSDALLDSASKGEMTDQGVLENALKNFSDIFGFDLRGSVISQADHLGALANTISSSLSTGGIATVVPFLPVLDRLAGQLEYIPNISSESVEYQEHRVLLRLGPTAFLNNLADVYFLLGLPERAHKLLNLSIQIGVKLGSRQHILDAYVARLAHEGDINESNIDQYMDQTQQLVEYARGLNRIYTSGISQDLLDRVQYHIQDPDKIHRDARICYARGQRSLLQAELLGILFYIHSQLLDPQSSGKELEKKLMRFEELKSIFYRSQLQASGNVDELNCDRLFYPEDGNLFIQIEFLLSRIETRGQYSKGSFWELTPDTRDPKMTTVMNFPGQQHFDRVTELARGLNLHLTGVRESSVEDNSSTTEYALRIGRAMVSGYFGGERTLRKILDAQFNSHPGWREDLSILMVAANITVRDADGELVNSPSLGYRLESLLSTGRVKSEIVRDCLSGIIGPNFRWEWYIEGDPAYPSSRVSLVKGCEGITDNYLSITMDAGDGTQLAIYRDGIPKSLGSILEDGLPLWMRKLMKDAIQEAREASKDAIIQGQEGKISSLQNEINGLIKILQSRDEELITLGEVIQDFRSRILALEQSISEKVISRQIAELSEGYLSQLETAQNTIQELERQNRGFRGNLEAQKIHNLGIEQLRGTLDQQDKLIKEITGTLHLLYTRLHSVLAPIPYDSIDRGDCDRLIAAFKQLLTRLDPNKLLSDEKRT